MHESNTDFDDEDDMPLYLWFRNSDSQTLSTPKIWENYVDVNRGISKCEKQNRISLVKIMKMKRKRGKPGKKKYPAQQRH